MVQGCVIPPTSDEVTFGGLRMANAVEQAFSKTAPPAP